MNYKINKSDEEIAEPGQVVTNSGHDWMRGKESGDAYFARARYEALRGQELLPKESTQSDNGVMEKLRLLLRRISSRSQSTH